MLKFTKDHEWVRVEGDIATIGITSHAQEQLGDLVFVELPRPGMISLITSYSPPRGLRRIRKP